MATAGGGGVAVAAVVAAAATAIAAALADASASSPQLTQGQSGSVIGNAVASGLNMQTTASAGRAMLLPTTFLHHPCSSTLYLGIGMSFGFLENQEQALPKLFLKRI